MSIHIVESLKKRRSYYAINKTLPVPESEITAMIKEVTRLVPDAFDMKSARVIVAFGKAHNALWDTIYDAFGGMVPHKKIDSFKAGAGTILYFYDESAVTAMQEQFPLYADNFPVWASQANGMLQLSIWSALRELNIGASLQHYNPVIDEAVHNLFEIPDNYRLLAQMPFGGIDAEPAPKETENINLRVHTF